jgi:ferric-dicitrate binding protein FerR (iron transport regulator)
VSLTDSDILELNELCNAVVDDAINDTKKARLSQWLATSEDARQFYVKAMGLSASLHHYASEMQTEARDAAVRGKVVHVGIWWRSVMLAAAACIAILLWFQFRPKASTDLQSVEYVARVTGSSNCEWASAQSLQPGDRLHKGQQLNLVKGLAEITFDSGAQVILDGTATLDVNSAWDATLRRGTIKAHVPPEAVGFRVSNHAVEVVDLGTEFTMIADNNGAAEVLVLKGEVEAAPRDAGEQDTILLHANESRRFADTGAVSNIADSKQKFALFTQPMEVDHFAQSAHYVHWSFDETGGSLIKADKMGISQPAFDARLDSDVPFSLDGSRTPGRWGRALKFDGRFFAKATVAGLSGNSPHTVAFWAKVPEDAPLSYAYAMVAWSTSSRKLGLRPVHISWNRNPTEGPLGALRTDFGGGYAMGATSLRDGRWHHLTVVFSPGADDNTPVQVKQYVDGRLESETIMPGKMHVVSSKSAMALTDILWLGCRISGKSPRRDRFHGEIDELFLADRGLEPEEIVQLMKDNQPLPASALALAQSDEP